MFACCRAWRATSSWKAPRAPPLGVSFLLVRSKYTYVGKSEFAHSVKGTNLLRRARVLGREELLPRKNLAALKDVANHLRLKGFGRFRGKRLSPEDAKSGDEESFLPQCRPEVAVIGRSNVGKSSLVNALSNKKRASTSPRPGKTRSLNWYLFAKEIQVVDLPGYGFSFAPKEKTAEWAGTVSRYFAARKNLKRVFVLIDSRHGIKQVDRTLFDTLEKANRNFQIVLTKVDLVDPTHLARVVCETKDHVTRWKKSINQTVLVSAREKTGLSTLRNLLYTFVKKARKEPCTAKKK